MSIITAHGSIPLESLPLREQMQILRTIGLPVKGTPARRKPPKKTSLQTATKAFDETRLTKPEALLLAQMRQIHLPEPTPQFFFARLSLGRQWRSDFAWPERMLLVEVEGGIMPYRDPHTGVYRERGRHLTISGFTEDCDKYNAAAMLGYRVLRFTSQMVTDGVAIWTIQQALGEVGDVGLGTT